MKISLIYVGKTNQAFVKEGFDMYKKRLMHYTSFEEICIEDVKNPKNLTSDMLKQLEGEKILKKIDQNDFVILLDEKGKNFNSVAFAHFMEQKMIESTKHIVFIIGAHFKVQLSAMTFSHQIIRLIFAEQLYRAFTIIKGESYHNA